MYPELYLDPGSSSGNTPNTGPKSLVPGESSCGGNGALVLHRVLTTQPCVIKGIISMLTGDFVLTSRDDSILETVSISL